MAKNIRLLIPQIFKFLSFGKDLESPIPEIENMKRISIFNPMRIKKAVFEGAPQTGAYPEKWKTKEFQISLKVSMPQKARPANALPIFPFSISLI